MTETNSSPRNRIKLIAAVLIVGIVSIVQPGCDCSSSDYVTAVPAEITSVTPASDSTGALVGVNVTAVFESDMDSTSVINAFSLSLNGIPVAASVTFDATSNTVTLDPDGDLLPGMQYIATIDSSVKDINGESPLSSDYVWSFTISPAMLLVSKNADGIPGNNTSNDTDIDASGRYIVFESTATNLSAVATSGRFNVYRKDTVTGDIVLVSMNESGVEADNLARNASISPDGRFVAFESTATNLSATATSGRLNVYRKDMVENKIILVSMNSSGEEANNIARNPSLSCNGKCVAFESTASNLVSPATTLNRLHVYRKDIVENEIILVSSDSTGNEASNNASNPTISADGRYVAFESAATDLVLPATTLNRLHVYRKDMDTGDIVLASSNLAGDEADNNASNPGISDDGRYIAFQSAANNLSPAATSSRLNVFLKDTGTDDIVLASSNLAGDEADNDASNPGISADGQYVVFESRASNLDPDTAANALTQIYLKDLGDDSVTMLSQLSDGSAGTRASTSAEISADGRYVSFQSPESFTTDDISTSPGNDIFRVHNSAYQ